MGHHLILGDYSCSNICYLQHGPKSKMEATIEAQQRKTGLLTDITKLHEQHLHKLDEMVDDIGKEHQVIKIRQSFQIRVEQIITQITSEEKKLRGIVKTFKIIIITAYNQKLAPRALSTDVLNNIVDHIIDIA